MLLWIAIGGGLRLMMGHHGRSESLFYYFRLEDQVPENHLLRLIDTYIDFNFVREQLKGQLQRDRKSIDRSGAAVAHCANRLSYGISSERSLSKNCACLWGSAASRGCGQE